MSHLTSYILAAVFGCAIGATVAGYAVHYHWCRITDEHHYRTVRILAARVPEVGEATPGVHSAAYWQRAVNALQAIYAENISDLLDRVRLAENHGTAHDAKHLRVVKARTAWLDYGPTRQNAAHGLLSDRAAA